MMEGALMFCVPSEESVKLVPVLSSEKQKKEMQNCSGALAYEQEPHCFKEFSGILFPKIVEKRTF